MGIFSKKKNTTTTTHTAAHSSAASNAILNALHDSVFVISGDGNIRYMNPAAAAMVNFPSEQAKGLQYASVIHLLDSNGAPVQGNQNPIATALRTSQHTESKEFNISKIKSREALPVHLTATPASPEITVVILRNITQELKEEQERSEFISTASHEMRTPVASIEGYLGLALSPQTATIDNRARAYLEKAHEASRHLGKLFRDLLDTTMLDDNKTKIKAVPVKMDSLVRDIADSMAPAIADKGLNYQFGSNDVATATISTTRKIEQLLYCSLDVDFLREIIGNLIDNAIKYTPTGSIFVYLQGDENEAIIVIADTGVGISQEHQKHIFQKFYRIDNSQTRDTEGTGLGLYIVKQRVEAMRGRIWVESTEGKGSKFSVALPRISSEEYERQKMAMESSMRPRVSTDASAPSASSNPAATNPKTAPAPAGHQISRGQK